MGLKTQILSLFREILVPQYRSLEFRAKIFAAMLLAKKKVEEKDFKELENILLEIYQDKKRIEILIATVKEYVQKANEYKSLNLDSLLKDIDRELKIHKKKFAKKIDFLHLRRLICKDDEEDALIQQRVYEFLLSEVKTYLDEK